MSNPNILLYAGNPVMPGNIGSIMDQLKISGINHVVLALCHVSADGSVLFFNNTPFVTTDSIIPAFESWPAQFEELLDGGIVRHFSASFGGDPNDVHDFRRISEIYRANNNSLFGTPLEFCFKNLKAAFPSITCIDMDNEEFVDRESFVAFCKMVREIGFDISFCPWAENNSAAFYFYLDSLQEIEQSSWGKGCVKRFNVQNYAWPPASPKNWTDEIHKRLKDFNTDGFINVGYWARSKNSIGSWDHSSPEIVARDFSYYYHTYPSVRGAFFWNLDCIMQTTLEPDLTPLPQGCAGYAVMGNYAQAIWDGMVREPEAAAVAVEK